MNIDPADWQRIGLRPQVHRFFQINAKQFRYNLRVSKQIDIGHHQEWNLTAVLYQDLNRPEHESRHLTLGVFTSEVSANVAMASLLMLSV